MKLLNLLLIAVCLCVANGFEVPEKFKKVAKMLHNTCVEQTGANEDTLSQCKGNVIPSDPKSKCYIHCIFDSVGMIDNLGKIDLISVAKIMDPTLVEVAEMLHKECPVEASEDFCDVAYKATKCYFEKHPGTIEYCHALLM